MSVPNTDIPQSQPSQAGPRVFVSYRRSDSPSAARQIAEALKERFGSDRVFFDTGDLRPGSEWLKDIHDRVRAADVIVAVIGPNWVTIADERGRRRVLKPEEEDIVRAEIEAALRGSARLIPVLVDAAALPARDALPRPFRPITDFNAVTLRHASWDQDIQALMSELAAPAPAPRPAVDAASPPAHSDDWQPRPGGPGEGHYRRAAKALSRGMLVPVLGAGVHAPADPGTWRPGCGRLPDAAELAHVLAERFGLAAEAGDLPAVAQHILAVEGPKPLERALRELVADPGEPGPVHSALARIPALLRESGTESYPLLVTTTHDTALERAFQQVNEPFDLAVCIAAGRDRGRFLHVPWYDAEDRPVEPITRPNEYVDFPMDEYGDLGRTVIVKIHGGAVHDAPPGLQVQTGFVITEDDYISYLSESSVENLIPTQLLTKLRDSHFLFIGYGVREWTLRVFLRRIWHEGEPGATSWAVQAGADELDDDLWRTLEVERFTVAPADYLADLEQCMRR